MVRTKIITTINQISSLAVPASTRFACFVMPTSWGPLDKVNIMTNYSAFVATYGELHTNNVAIRKFFDNGGVAKVLRVAEATKAKASLELDNATTAAITLTAKYEGTTGNYLTVEVKTNGSNKDIYISNGSTTESYINLASNLAIVAALSESSLVTAVKNTDDLIDSITPAFLTGGNNGDTTILFSDYETAINTYLPLEDFNMLLTPGVTSDATQKSILSTLLLRITNDEKYCRYICGVGTTEDISTIESRTLVGERATLIAPGLVDNGISYDGTFLAAAYAGYLSSVGYGISGTNKPLDIDGLTVLYNNTELDVLTDAGVAPVALSQSEFKVNRGITRVADQTNNFFQEVVLDEFDQMYSNYETIIKTQVGQQNTFSKRNLLATRLDSVSSTGVSDKLIEEFKDAVVIEGTGANSIAVEIGIKPIRATEFIYFTINIQ